MTGEMCVATDCVVHHNSFCAGVLICVSLHFLSFFLLPRAAHAKVRPMQSAIALMHASPGKQPFRAVAMAFECGKVELRMYELYSSTRVASATGPSHGNSRYGSGAGEKMRRK